MTTDDDQLFGIDEELPAAFEAVGLTNVMRLLMGEEPVEQGNFSLAYDEDGHGEFRLRYDGYSHEWTMAFTTVEHVGEGTWFLGTPGDSTALTLSLEDYETIDWTLWLLAFVINPDAIRARGGWSGPDADYRFTVQAANDTSDGDDE